MWAAAAARPKGGDPPPASSLVSPTEKVAVLDANALIAAGGGLRSYTTALADRAVTIKEVLAEVRDPVSRAALAAATCAGALAITVMEPSAASLAEGE
jgi:putative intracellular protease/amidase